MLAGIVAWNFSWGIEARGGEWSSVVVYCDCNMCFDSFLKGLTV